jgi:hypothetical protein
MVGDRDDGPEVGFCSNVGKVPKWAPSCGTNFAANKELQVPRCLWNILPLCQVLGSLLVGRLHDGNVCRIVSQVSTI